MIVGTKFAGYYQLEIGSDTQWEFCDNGDVDYFWRETEEYDVVRVTFDGDGYFCHQCKQYSFGTTDYIDKTGCKHIKGTVKNILEAHDKECQELIDKYQKK